MSMQTLTSSFPSRVRSPHGGGLNIIFYTPPPAKSREVIPLDADESDIDMAPTEFSQHEGPAAVETLDFASRFTGEDVQNLVNADTTVRTLTSPWMRFGEHSIPLPNSFDVTQSEDAIRSELLKSPEPLDLWAEHMQSVLGEQCRTVEEAVWRNSGDVGTTVQSRSPHDESILTPKLFHGEGAIAALPSGSPTSLPRELETNRPAPPSHPQDCPLGDMSPLAERIHVKQTNVIAGYEQRSAGPAQVESRQASQDDTSRDGSVDSTITGVSENSACDQAYSSRSAVIIHVADNEATDSDGPPVTRRRRRPLPHIRGSRNTSQRLTPQSGADSIDAEPLTLRRRKRLLRRNEVPRGSSAPGTEVTSASSSTSRSNKGGEQWHVQCFIERAMVGGREVVTIQLPLFDLCARSGPVFALSPSADTSQTLPSAVVRKSGKRRRRRRFTREEDDLVVELKEQKDPKLLWTEIQRHFPHRSVGSLQVHYSNLKKRHPSSSAL